MRSRPTTELCIHSQGTLVTYSEYSYFMDILSEYSDFMDILSKYSDFMGILFERYHFMDIPLNKRQLIRGRVRFDPPLR